MERILGLLCIHSFAQAGTFMPTRYACRNILVSHCNHADFLLCFAFSFPSPPNVGPTRPIPIALQGNEFKSLSQCTPAPLCELTSGGGVTGGEESRPCCFSSGPRSPCPPSFMRRLGGSSVRVSPAARVPSDNCSLTPRRRAPGQCECCP